MGQKKTQNLSIIGSSEISIQSSGPFLHLNFLSVRLVGKWLEHKTQSELTTILREKLAARRPENSCLRTHVRITDVANDLSTRIAYF